MSELEEVRQAVDRGLPASIDFLRALVREPSLLGNEEGAQALVEERLRWLGFEVRSVQPDPGVLASGRRAACHSCPTRIAALLSEHLVTVPDRFS